MPGKIEGKRRRRWLEIKLAGVSGDRPLRVCGSWQNRR